jgi:hypothetical protein
MDGRETREHCEVDEAQCDLCETQQLRGTKRKRVEQSLSHVATVDERERRRLEHDRQMREQATLLIQRRKTEQVAYKLERLERHLQGWRDVCAICMAVDSMAEPHDWETCPNASEEQIRVMKEAVRWLASVKWEQFSRCNYCGAPQALCNKWVEDASAQGRYKSLGWRGTCQFDRTLGTAVAALFAFRGAQIKPWLDAQMQRAMVMDGSKELRHRQWLGGKVQIGQRNASRMCCLLYAWEEGHVYRHQA